MSLNLATLLVESAKSSPNHTAIILDSFRMSYAELDLASNKFASVLQHAGVQPGQKVALMMPNVPQFAVIYYGILKAGGVVVPLNVLLKAPEVHYHLSDSDAVALIAWEGFAEHALPGYVETETCQTLWLVNAPGSSTDPDVRGGRNFNKDMATASPSFEMAQTMPDDTAVILYTSGTTGRPKGAELTHFNMFFNARVSIEFLGINWEPNDVVLVALPLFHAFGQSCQLNTTIGVGGTITLMPRFDPVKAYEVIQRDKVTKFSGVPTMFFYLLNHPDRTKYDLSSLTGCTSGGSAIPVEVLNRWEQLFGFKILEGFGLSETSPTASFNVMFKPSKPGSIGLPVWGVEMRLVDDDDKEVPAGEPGELCIRGHNVMKGYYKRPEATAEVMRNGWFHTGDIATKDTEGYFFIVDRKKDMLLRGGYNVYPREIEEVLYTHAAIAECAVIGVPDPALGEEVKAIVVLKDGASVTEDELREFTKARLASYKYPRYIEIRTEPLPKNATGKILKRELRQS
jgi:long-chain acyl-CoA synthetase